MKFKPILGSDLSGHIGGVVASHNTYGPYFRQRVKPVNKKTPAMQAQRTAVAAVAQTWRTLDPTVQTAWTAASVIKTSRKGDKITLTGAAAFQYVNTLRQRINLPLVTSPPSGTPSSALTLPTVVLTSSLDLSVTFAADPWNAASGGVIVNAALLTSAGRSFTTAKLAVSTVNHPGTSPVVLHLPFAVPIGGRARVEFHATAPDGSQSTYQSVDVLNTSFPPPVTKRTVLSVTLVGTQVFLWLFDGIINVTPGTDSVLTINGDITAVVAQAGPRSLTVTYTGLATASGQPWAIAGQPASFPELVFYPQSGITI